VRSVWGISYIKCKLRERKTNRKEETAADKAVRRTTNATVWMAIFTMMLTVLSGLTWWEIHSGGTDTHDLAVAAGQQAVAAGKQADAAGKQVSSTKDLADRMKDQADGTKVIAQQAVIQANANKRLAQNAVDTLKNTRDSFQDEQRAWVGVQDAGGAAPTETLPWRVRIVFFNSGRSPARSVQRDGMYITSDHPLNGPGPEQVSQLIFSPAQSIAPQGKYNFMMGEAPPARASTELQLSGNRGLISQLPQIKDGRLFLYYFGILKYDDGFGRQRETQFCILLANPTTGEVGFCDGFNDMN
jgi:hypothetical protein